MKYTAVKQDDLAREFKDVSGQKWKYLSKKEYKNLEKENKKIFADVLKKDSHSAAMFLTHENQSIGLYTYTGKGQFLERTAGYIPVVDEQGHSGCVRVRKRSWLLPLLLVVILVLGIATFIFGTQQNGNPTLDDSAVAYRIDGVENNDPSKIMLPGLDTITLEEGNRHVRQVLFNPEGNPCYFKYRLILEPENKVLFESKLIEPGTAITEFDLDSALQAGTYDARLEVETVSVEDKKTPLNNGVIKVTLDVKEQGETE